MTNPESHKELLVFRFADYESWLKWLAENFAQDKSVWVKFAKKSSGIQSISYEEAREGAIIYGWIDGLINGIDDTYYLRKFSPRRKRSQWSKINREIASSLIKQKTMKPSGLAQVTAAKQDGRWDAAYDPQSTIEVPPELQTFLKANKRANAFFESITKANRYAFLYRIQTAKRADTRDRRLKTTFEMLVSQQVYHPRTTTTAIQAKRKK